MAPFLFTVPIILWISHASKPRHSEVVKVDYDNGGIVGMLCYEAAIYVQTSESDANPTNTDGCVHKISASIMGWNLENHPF